MITVKNEVDDAVWQMHIPKICEFFMFFTLNDTWLPDVAFRHPET